MTMALAIQLRVDGAGQVTGEIAKTSKTIGSLSDHAREAATGTDRLAESIKKIGHYGAAYLGVSQLANYAKSLVTLADGYSNMVSRLKLATSSQTEYNVAYEQLYAIAQKTAAPLSETIALYARMAPGLKQLGANQAQLLAVTDLVGKSLALSGASAAEAGASMTQFAQALGSGKLRGDEFNSLMEQAPRLMKGLADGLGLPIGKLREMAEAGELSAGKVVAALLSQKEIMEREFLQMPLTVGKAWQKLENQFARLVGETDAQTGATQELAAAVGVLANNLTPLVGLLTPLLKIGLAFAGLKLATMLLASAAGAGILAGALTWLKTEIAATAIAMSVGGVGGALALGTAYTGLGTAAAGAASGVTLLAGALKGLLIAYAGYELGKYFYDNFLSVKLASVALIDVLQRGWENIRYGAEVMWIGIKAAWTGGTHIIKESWADLIGYLAKGADLVGASETAAKMRQYADSFLPPDSAFDTYKKQLASAGAAHALALAGIKKNNGAVTSLMIADANKRNGVVVSAAGDLKNQLKEMDGKADKDKKAAAEKAAQAHAKLIDAYMNRELDAAEKVHEAMVKAYDASALQKLIAAQDVLLKNIDAYADSLNAAALHNADLADEVAGLRARNEEIGLSASALLTLNDLRLEGIILAREEALANAKASGGYTAALEEEIRLLKEKRALIAAGAGKQAAADVAKDAAEEWKRASADIERSLTDALMRGFEGGKGWATNFMATLKNMFSSLVLRPIIQPIAQYGANLITGALGLGASGTASASGATGAASNAMSLGSSLASAFSPGAISYAIGEGVAGLASTLGATTGVATGLGSMMAAAVPYIGAIMAAVALVKAFDQGGTPHLGNTQQFGLDGRANTVSTTDYMAGGGQTASGLYGGLPGWLFGENGASPYDDAIAAFGQQMISTINADMQRLGGTLGKDFALQFGFAAESEAETASGGFARVLLNGEPILNIYKRYAEDGKAGIEAYMREVAPKVELIAIQSADGLSPAIDALADAVDVSTASLSEISAALTRIGDAGQALGLQAAFTQLNQSLGATDDQIISTGLALRGLAGNFDVLQAGISTYYQAFFSEEERLAKTTRALGQSFASLGLAMPDSKDAFRGLVESLDLTTASGQQAFVTLMGLAPTFAQVADAAAAATQAVLLEAQQAAQRIAQERTGLETQLLQAQGDTAALRARELAALDESNRALQQQIWALGDQAAAAQLAADAAQQLSDKLAANMAAIAQERTGLETQLLQAQGDTAALRARELAALDESNRALQQQIWAVQDKTAADQLAQQAAEEATRAAQQAAEEQARAAEQLRTAWQYLTDSLIEEVRRIRGLVGGETGQSLAALQADFTLKTAQARAGDQDAAKALPQVSRALLDLAANLATSSVDLQRIQSGTAASLEQTIASLAGRYGLTVPAFAAGGLHDGGLRLVGEYGPELEATGPARYYNAQQTRGLLGGDSGLLAEVRALRAEVAALREENSAENQAIASHAARTARTLERVMPDGDALAVRAVA